MGLVTEIFQSTTKIQRNENDQLSEMTEFWVAAVISLCRPLKNKALTKRPETARLQLSSVQNHNFSISKTHRKAFYSRLTKKLRLSTNKFSKIFELKHSTIFIEIRNSPQQCFDWFRQTSKTTGLFRKYTFRKKRTDFRRYSEQNKK